MGRAARLADLASASCRTRLRVGRGRRVRFLGVVSDARLCRLYRTAGWSIYPSLYEGFGFPVLDALRHGTPVLASGNSSLREFRVPGLHLFDPCDAATVDDAWQALRRDRPVEIPRGPLDRRYSLGQRRPDPARCPSAESRASGTA